MVRGGLGCAGVSLGVVILLCPRGRMQVALGTKVWLETLQGPSVRVQDKHSGCKNTPRGLWDTR